MGDFSDFFETIEKNLDVIPAIRQDLYDELNTLTCYPNEIQVRLNTYESRFSKVVNNFINVIFA